MFVILADHFVNASCPLHDKRTELSIVKYHNAKTSKTFLKYMSISNKISDGDFNRVRIKALKAYKLQRISLEIHMFHRDNMISVTIFIRFVHRFTFSFHSIFGRQF